MHDAALEDALPPVLASLHLHSASQVPAILASGFLDIIVQAIIDLFRNTQLGNQLLLLNTNISAFLFLCSIRNSLARLITLVQRCGAAVTSLVSTVNNRIIQSYRPIPKLKMAHWSTHIC